MDGRVTYCSYCKVQTLHKLRGDLPGIICSKCGSTRDDTIQGFDASLM